MGREWKGGKAAAEKRYREANKEARAAYDRAYYERNRERRLAQQKARYEGDKTGHIDRQIKGRYGVDRKEMEVAQGGACAICRAPFDGSTPCVDHDHACCPSGSSCGRCVRGLLCSPCNKGLGNFADDPDRLMAAVAYLLTRVDLLAAKEL